MVLEEEATWHTSPCFSITVPLLKYCKSLTIISLFNSNRSNNRKTRIRKGRIRILDTTDVTSNRQVQYLSTRRIPITLASQFCREVRYSWHSKVHYGIGFKNDSGGYEIRNPYFKGSCSPMDITTLDFGLKGAAVFEGFSDFLSHLASHQKQSQTQTIS